MHLTQRMFGHKISRRIKYVLQFFKFLCDISRSSVRCNVVDSCRNQGRGKETPGRNHNLRFGSRNLCGRFYQPRVSVLHLQKNCFNKGIS